jgi:hypothetical protein
MALIDCAECGKRVSDKAVACPHCGNPKPAAWTPPRHSRGGTARGMRYLVAAVACLALLLGFAVVMVFVFGTTKPGAVPLLLLFGVMVLTWRAIIKGS